MHKCISSVDSNAADSDLQDLATCLQSHPWIDAASHLDPSSIRMWLGAIGSRHPNVRDVVGAVLAVVTAGSDAAKISLLQRQEQDGSVGVLLALFVADETMYCSSAPAPRAYGDLVLPSWSVECGVQGNIMVGVGPTEPGAVCC